MTPQLLVTEPATWFHLPHYEGPFQLSFLFNADSPFYRFYSLRVEEEFLLRKLGHVLSYATLTYLLYLNLSIKNLWVKLLVVWGAVTLFGFLDEINQTFIYSRDGRLLDVILNSTASLLTVVIISTVVMISKKKAVTKMIKNKRSI
ncbi:VanZ family protein [Desertibacillus haloalkaliphilus]|nr:VanZ family protein [Desertibacillus haloalkaliphilus]